MGPSAFLLRFRSLLKDWARAQPLKELDRLQTFSGQVPGGTALSIEAREAERAAGERGGGTGRRSGGLACDGAV